MEAGTAIETGTPSATRKDLQLGRRLVHFANGAAVATAYALLFTHRQVVHAFGIVACLVYILDRVRIQYPDLAQRIPWMNRLFFRAEEQFKESAMTPFVIATLLTILTFPKPIALIAIYTLAAADPAAALVGITWGRHHLVPNRSLEGSLAFFAVTLGIALSVLGMNAGGTSWTIAGAAILLALAAALFEMVPLRLDDNLTIPLFVGFAGWAACAIMGVQLDGLF